MACFRKRNGKWQVQIRRMDCIPISKTFRRKKDAEYWARETESNLDRGCEVTPVLFPSSAIFADLIEKYIVEFSEKKKSKITEVFVLHALLNHPIAKRKIFSLQAHDFALYRDQRLKEVKASTVCRQLSIIQHLFEVAIKEWGIPLRMNCIKGIRKPTFHNQRTRRISSGELKAIYRSALACKNPLILPIIELALFTALRRGEILSITRDCIDLSKGTLFLPETKSGYSRDVPLSSNALKIFRNLAPNSGTRIFPISANAFNLAWRRLIKRTNIRDLRFHDLRHEAISRFFEIGLNIPEVALISGHRDYRMLQRYTHLKATTVARKLG